MTQIAGAYTLLASKIQFRDLGGVNQLLLRLDQGGVGYTIGAPKTSEAMERGDHLPGQAPVKVRTGGFSLAEASTQIIDAERRLDAAFAASPLPESPNAAKVEQWMLGAYLEHWNTHNVRANLTKGAADEA